MFQRPQLDTLKVRLKSAPRFLQILAGPRQVDKTILARLDTIVEPTLVRDVMGLARVDKPALPVPSYRSSILH